MTRVGEPPESPRLARRFVLAALRVRLDRDGLDEVRTLAGAPKLSWHDVGKLVWAERVGPLVYHALRGHGILPLDLESALEASYYATSKRNLLLLHELARAITLLASAGIELVVLKGAALIEAVYRNVGVRPLYDIDVLVRPGDVRVAVSMLQSAGFVRETAEARAGAALDYENELRLCKSGQVEVQLELHWNLIDSPFYQRRLSPVVLHETARPLSVRGVATSMLSDEMHLLHLCGHIMLHHRGHELLWLHDIAELLTACEARLDWDRVLTLARDSDLVIPLNAALASVVRDWDVRVPAPALERLRSLAPSVEERGMARRLVADRSPIQRLWDDTASMHQWSERVRFLLINGFPSPGYMRQRYKIRRAWVLPLCYPYRWLRGLRDAF